MKKLFLILIVISSSAVAIDNIKMPDRETLLDRFETLHLPCSEKTRLVSRVAFNKLAVCEVYNVIKTTMQEDLSIIIQDNWFDEDSLRIYLDKMEKRKLGILEALLQDNPSTLVTLKAIARRDYF